MMADIRFFLEMGRRSLGIDEALDIGLSAEAEDLGRIFHPLTVIARNATTKQCRAASPASRPLALDCLVALATTEIRLCHAHLDRQADQVGGARDAQLCLDLAAGVGDGLV